MSKIEEITELIVNEINDFNKGITKLEKINDQISTTKIRLDLAEYKSIIESHQQKMNEQINAQERFKTRFESLLKKAKVYPNWAVIIFIISLLFGAVSTPYAFILKYNTNKNENEAYEKGISTYKNHMNTFFKRHPKSKQTFEKWEENSN